MSNLACPTSYDYFLNTIFEKEDREKFERLVALIEIKKPSEIPVYTVLAGPTGSGKSILLNILCFELFKSLFSFCDMTTSNSFIPQGIYLIQEDVPVQKAIENVRKRDLERNNRYIFTTNREFENSGNTMIIHTTGRRVNKHILFSIFLPSMRCDSVATAFKIYCVDKLISEEIKNGE